MSKQTIPPKVNSGLWRVLREKLAARIDSAAAMVEADHPVSAYYHPDDAQDRQYLVGVLEKTFKIQLDASTFEKITTVGELAELIAAQKRGGTSGSRIYIIVYKNHEGHIIEEHVRANNHTAAIESLRESGLDKVLSVTREEDENRDFHRSHRTLKRCLIPLALGLLAAAGAFYFFWLRRH